MSSHPVREKYREYLLHAEERQKPAEHNRGMVYAVLASIFGVCATAAFLSRFF
jgi:hypothetical protein